MSDEYSHLKDEPADPEEGDVYEDARDGTLYKIVYYDEDLVLLKAARTHRLQRRHTFNIHTASWRLKYRPDETITVREPDADWTEVKGVGENTADNLYDEGILTASDALDAGKEEIESIDGMGDKNTARLIGHASTQQRHQ